MKTSELEGALLDYWVARAERLDVRLESHATNPPRPIACWLVRDGQMDFSQPYSPSTDWAQGGPIIEREGLDITVGMQSATGPKHIVFWSAERDDIVSQFGKTPLIAAMRAYVASKFGDEVPDATAPSHSTG